MNNYLQLALIGLIFGIVGYVIGKMSSKPSGEVGGNLKSDLDNCKQKNTSLQVEIDRLKLNVSEKANTFVGNSAAVEFDPKAAKAAFGKTIKQDDLKIVEGIGPKIEELFKTSGILSWKALGETSVDRLREILSKAGERYQIHDPGTWPKQSKMAYEGKWQELKDWQSTLDGGREV